MLKNINKNQTLQTNHSKTKRRQANNCDVSASKDQGGQPLVIVREQPVLNNRRADEPTLNKGLSPSSEAVKKEHTRTQFEGVLKTPFYKLLDTQREVSPVMSHRICGKVPFTGKKVGEAEKNSYTFSCGEFGTLTKEGVFYCGSPMCLWCEGKRRKDNQEEFKMVLENASPEKVFITFTAKPRGDLKEHVEKMKDAFGRVVESVKRECVKRYGQEPIYVKVCEATGNPYRGRGHTNFHLHGLFTFSDNKTDNDNVLVIRSLKWMETYLVDKWSKFGTKVGLVVRKSAQQAKVVGKGPDDIAKLSIYLTKGLALELASSGLKDSKTNYSLKSIVALVSEGCGQAHRLYRKMASALFGTNFITRSKGWRELYKKVSEEEELKALEEAEQEEEEEGPLARELLVGRLTYKGCVSQFGAWVDDLILGAIRGGYGEDAYRELETHLSVEWEEEMLSDAEEMVFQELIQRQEGMSPEQEKELITENFENNLKELISEWMVRHRVEAHSVRGRTFSFKTKEFVVEK
jgi:hypothetical protein